MANQKYGESTLRTIIKTRIKGKVHVRFGGRQSKTDGNTIYVADLPDSADPKARNHADVHASHEAQHVAELEHLRADGTINAGTSLGGMLLLVLDKVADKHKRLCGDILNAVEDIRIDVKVNEMYPGTAYKYRQSDVDIFEGADNVKKWRKIDKVPKLLIMLMLKAKNKYYQDRLINTVVSPFEIGDELLYRQVLGVGLEDRVYKSASYLETGDIAIEILDKLIEASKKAPPPPPPPSEEEESDEEQGEENEEDNDSSEGESQDDSEESEESDDEDESSSKDSGELDEQEEESEDSEGESSDGDEDGETSEEDSGEEDSEPGDSELDGEGDESESDVDDESEESEESGEDDDDDENSDDQGGQDGKDNGEEHTSDESTDEDSNESEESESSEEGEESSEEDGSGEDSSNRSDDGDGDNPRDDESEVEEEPPLTDDDLLEEGVDLQDERSSEINEEAGKSMVVVQDDVRDTKWQASKQQDPTAWDKRGARYVAGTETKIRQLFFDERADRRYKGLRSGKRLSPRHLHRMRDIEVGSMPRIWQKTLKGKNIETAVFFSLDESGSMNSLGRVPWIESVEVTTAICRVLDKVGVKYAVEGWSGDADVRGNEISGYMHTRRYHNWQGRINVSKIPDRAMGDCTPSAMALDKALSELARRSEVRKVLFFLTDGWPNNSDEYIYMEERVKDARSKGIFVFGFGIGVEQGDHNMQRVFKEGWVGLKGLTPGKQASAILNRLKQTFK